mmetsp:Transcript_30178/g.76928  ORF Transcript_30178/g.76928 Transcript_30178/m.76928 type:complete len:229 (-) Transcript_30178:481-1167(-)
MHLHALLTRTTRVARWVDMAGQPESTRCLSRSVPRAQRVGCSSDEARATGPTLSALPHATPASLPSSLLPVLAAAAPVTLEEQGGSSHSTSTPPTAESYTVLISAVITSAACRKSPRSASRSAAWLQPDPQGSLATPSTPAPSCRSAMWADSSEATSPMQGGSSSTGCDAASRPELVCSSRCRAAPANDAPSPPLLTTHRGRRIATWMWWSGRLPEPTTVTCLTSVAR